ncbi:MAG: hypothetical protein CVU91_10940 [Firmicutes bacterium HGW-Firmicutes-16]|nr:MAG: hypothetical protein CVU91_10940 [Firmicutes bacterium HGW-Firmicutes-16]
MAGLNYVLEDGKLPFAVETHIEAEHAVLGSMLIDSSCVGVVMAEANENDFSDELRPIFIAFRELYFAKEVVDPVAVLNKVGIAGMHYQRLLLDLMQVTPTAANVNIYLKIMKEQSLVRRAGAMGFELMSAHSLEEAHGMVDELNKLFCGRQNVKIVSFTQGIADFYTRHDGTKAPEYLRWGFPSLNKILTAEDGDFIILGGYPSAGKTVLALEFAWQMANFGKKRVGVFSLETKDSKLYDRLLSRAAGVPFDEIKHNTITDDSWKSVAELGSLAESIKLDVIKAAGMTANDIRAIALSQHYDIVIIDYLQLISSGSRYKGNRTEEVAGISMALHTFAQDSEVTVIALSQLTRPDKTVKSTAPTMSSLRESGQLEQDADIIMLLYLINEEVPDGDRRLKIAKNKDGPRGYITLGFEPKLMRFAQVSSRPDELPKKERSRFSELPDGDVQETLEVFNKTEGGSA